MRYFTLLLVVILCVACRKNEPASPPGTATLVFPENNSECTTGTEINPTTTRVQFRWQQATNTDNYEITVTNLITNVSQSTNTAGLSAEVTLQKGVPYTWSVKTSNRAVLEEKTSQAWRFYNAGFQTSYAPFPAEMLVPELGKSVFKDSNDEVTLSWSGADIDNDIESFELYFSTENPPNTLIATITTGATIRKVAVDGDTVYYWKVITIDSAGNSSDSGVFDFRVH